MRRPAWASGAFFAYETRLLPELPREPVPLQVIWLVPSISPELGQVLQHPWSVRHHHHSLPILLLLLRHHHVLPQGPCRLSICLQQDENPPTRSFAASLVLVVLASPAAGPALAESALAGTALAESALASAAAAAVVVVEDENPTPYGQHQRELEP